MTSLEDAELLRRYAAEKSDAAFAELVRRHVNPVYAFALRRVGGDAHLAEDVAQIVFTTLARKAGSLADRLVLGGWLCRATHFAARDVVRAESRRRARESEAHIMHESSTDSDSAKIDWEKLQPMLDETMGELNDADRDAVWLRFFEGKSFAEVGARLRLTENTARMRVDRALDKLHAALARRGVSSTAAALGIALANQAGVAAPMGLAASVTGAALAGATTSGGVGALLAILTMSKIKIGIVSAVVVVATVGVGGSWWLQRENAALQRETAELRRENGEREAASEKQSRRAQDLAVTPPPSAPVAPPAAANKAVAGAPTGTDLMAVMTPVENLVNAGRATPVAAVQTLIWAALKGEDDELAATLVLNKTAREKAEAWRAALPVESQAKFATVEKLPGLFLTEEIVRKAAAVQVLDATDNGTGLVTVRARTTDVTGRVGASNFPMQHGPDGWRLIVPEEMIDAIRRSSERADGKSPVAHGTAGR